MNEIMNKLFEQYNFAKTWEEDNRMFYVNTDKNVVSYFILNFIDCTNISDKEELIRAELDKLEEEYIDAESDKKGIKYSIINSFKTVQEISELPEPLLCSCTGERDRKHAGNTDAGGDDLHTGRNTGRQGIYPSERMCLGSGLPGAGNGLWILSF